MLGELLMQDECAKLSRWLACRLGTRREYEETQKDKDTRTTKDTQTTQPSGAGDAGEPQQERRETRIE